VVGAYLALDHPEAVKAFVISNGTAGLAQITSQVQKYRMINLAKLLNLLDHGDTLRAAEIMTAGAFSPGYREKYPDVFNAYLALKLKNNPQGIASLIRSLVNLPPRPTSLA